MSENRNTAPGVTSAESGKVDQVAFQGTTISVQNYTMMPGSVASVLLMGKENAVPGREIRRTLGLKDAREVSSLVEQERRRGVPICASCDNRNPGYYMPASSVELEEYCRSLRGRIGEINRTLEALEDTLTGQERIDLTKG